jgi:hypothetical protein
VYDIKQIKTVETGTLSENLDVLHGGKPAPLK